MKHFIDYDPQRPNIVFVGIDVVLEGFRAHVKGRPYVYSLFGIGSCLLGKAEVGNFDRFVPEEDVGRFEVAMEETMFCDMQETHEDLSDEGESFFFRQFVSLFEQVLQISLVAELSDDVAIVSSTENVVALEHVGVVEFLEGFDLTLQHTLLWLSLNCSDVDNLDGYFFLGLVVGAPVNN